MKVMTYEGTVENGQIRLSEPVSLPEKARVFVIVPEAIGVPRVHVGSPRLAQPERAVDFVMEVVEEARDAGLR